MLGRVLHLSDLHVGAHDNGRESLEAGVRALVEEEDPEVVLVTGDLTHRNRADQHAHAAAFLRSLGRPLVVLPGNHDLPALPPGRVTAPFAAFCREWDETEPAYASERVAVCGLCSVRPWKYQRGALSSSQLDRAASVLGRSASGALRIVALHHHLGAAPWRQGKRPIPRRTHTLARLAAAGAELVVSGHTHQSLVVERREFLARVDGPAPVVIATAPDLGNPRPSRPAEASGMHLYEASDAAVRVRTLAWSGTSFAAVADRIFARRGTDA